MATNRTNYQVNVHPDVKHGAKVYAAQTGMSLGALTEAALLAYGVAPIPAPAPRTAAAS